MNFPLIANIAVFVILLFVLAQARHKQWSLAKKVLVGLVMGVVFGLALHTIYGADSQVLKTPFSGSILSATAMCNCYK